LCIVLRVVIAGHCAGEETTVSDGLIAHWKFAASAGNLVRDSSGESNDGRIIPANTPKLKWGTGNFGGSLYFSGDNDYFVRVQPSASLNGLKQQITVVAFIYPRRLWA